MKAYLAGPDVFYPNAISIGEEKKKLCSNHGITGLYPLDNEVTGSDLGYAIFLANRRLMDQADICIANLTPFRGPSADVGTVLEMGYMYGLGKPVFAYTHDSVNLLRRTIEHGRHSYEIDGKTFDCDGNTIEDFGLHDNLMIDGIIRAQGFEIICPATDNTYHSINDLSIFERCVKSAADYIAIWNMVRPKYNNLCNEVILETPGIPVMLAHE